MRRKIRRFFLSFVSVALMALGFNSTAQDINPYDYISRSIDSKNNFDEIPLGDKVNAAFKSYYGAIKNSDFDLLSEEDQNLIMVSQTQAPFVERAFNLLNEACEYFTSTNRDDLDVRLLSDMQNSAHEIELQDKNTFFTNLFNQLSREGQIFITEKIDSMEGSGNISISTIDFEKIGRDHPEATKDSYLGLCKSLPASHANRILFGSDPGLTAIIEFGNEEK